MKLIHLSDLHLGKKVNEFSMQDDQKYILDQILDIIKKEAPDGVLIAGDVYDKSVPGAEATLLFDDFLVKLAALGTQVYIISGNHDSAERLSFGRRLMDVSGVHIAPVYSGKTEPFELKDEFGSVKIWLLPFIKPANVRKAFPDAEIESYTDALRVAVQAMDADPAERNVLVTHQFVTGAARSDSEEINVGGSDNVDASVFDGFDYVALGHIHGPQDIKKEGLPRIRYCGSPLKYSFSEADHIKSVTVAELGEKGSVELRTVLLKPLRDMKQIKGSYDQLMSKSFYEAADWLDDYIRVTLTDEDDVPNAVANLRVVYKNLMKLDYDNTRTRLTGFVEGPAEAESKSPLELFEELYEKQNGVPMSEEQKSFAAGLIEKIWEDAQ